MTGLSSQNNVVRLSDALGRKDKETILSAAMSSVAGDTEDPATARALVAVSIYPNGDFRHTVSMVQPEDVQLLIGSLLDLIDKLIEFRDEPLTI